jgi:hypothetical protein
MNLRLNPLYKKLLMLSIVLGPMIWLLFTDDGQRRADLALLFVLGKGELNLAIESLHSDMTEAQFREQFPDFDLTCDEGANPFGDRLCTGEVGAFSGIPSRAFTLFLLGDRLRAAKLNYRRAYHETLKGQLTRRVGSPVPQSLATPVPVDGPVSWVVPDGLLLLPPQEPDLDVDAALMWLSEAAMRQRVELGDGAG